MPFFRKKSAKEKPEKNASKPPTGPSTTLPSPTQQPGLDTAHGLQRSPTTPNGDIGIPENPLAPSAHGAKPKILLRTASQQDADIGDLGYVPKESDPMQTSSRLSKTIHEVLHDKEALPYFIQYMDSRGMVQLIKFWLDAESFQAATLSRIRTHSLNVLRKSSVIKTPTKAAGSASQDSSQSSQVQLNDPQGQGHRVKVQGQVQNNDTQMSSTECATGQVRSDPDGCEGPSHAITNAQERSIARVDSDKTVNKSDSKPSSDSTVVQNGAQLNTGKGKDSSSDDLGEKLRRSVERDAVNIYSKYISLDATQPIGIDEFLRNQTISKICKEDGQVDPQCFAECQKFALDLMEKDHYPDFLRSEFHCKHQIDVLTSGKVYLADILYNDTAMFYFMEFMEQESGMDLLQFWLALDNFQEHLASQHSQYDGNEAQADAMVLYDKYFSLQATLPLGFDDKTRFEVESNICREGGPLPDCFATPKKMAFHTIDQNYFGIFLQSELYFKYLSELISTIQASQDGPQIKTTKLKRSGSDASSDTHSIGGASTKSEDMGNRSKNTLLATSDSTGVKKALNKLAEGLDMQMDPFDAPLWTRNMAGKLTLGSVNEFGQFVSEYDPEPDHDKKKESRWSRKKKEKDKAQEDAAWQIAQMLIKDVMQTQQIPETQEVECKPEVSNQTDTSINPGLSNQPS